jgi:hypothetical protein
LFRRFVSASIARRIYGGCRCGFSSLPPPGRSVRKVLVELSFSFFQVLFDRLLLGFHVIPPSRERARRGFARLSAHPAPKANENRANGKAKTGPRISEISLRCIVQHCFKVQSRYTRGLRMRSVHKKDLERCIEGVRARPPRRRGWRPAEPHVAVTIPEGVRQALACSIARIRHRTAPAAVLPRYECATWLSREKGRWRPRRPASALEQPQWPAAFRTFRYRLDSAPGCTGPG